MNKNSATKAAAEGLMKRIPGIQDEMLSADIIGDTGSEMVHALSTRVVQGAMVKAQVWYNNEYGCSRRLLGPMNVVS
jgi:glyceraldehyde 3-phosphate dehydrogenase